MPFFNVIIMNIAAKVVTDALLGEKYKTVIMGDRVCVFFPLTIKLISRVFNEFSQIEDVAENGAAELMNIPKNAPRILKGISYALAGNVDNYKEQAETIYQELQNATTEEIKLGMEALLSQIGGSDFFVSAALARNATKMAATSLETTP